MGNTIHNRHYNFNNNILTYKDLIYKILGYNKIDDIICLGSYFVTITDGNIINNVPCDILEVIKT